MCLKVILMRLLKALKIQNKQVMKANILIIRDEFTEKSTLGKLYLNGEFYGHTLELAWKDNEKNVSCVPKGVYNARKRSGDESGKYKYQHIEILDVPNRSKILIHIGNYPKSTQGCVLLGSTRALNFVGNSRKAFYSFMYDLQEFDDLEVVIKNR
jgi:hypothetical protein